MRRDGQITGEFEPWLRVHLARSRDIHFEPQLRRVFLDPPQCKRALILGAYVNLVLYPGYPPTHRGLTNMVITARMQV